MVVNRDACYDHHTPPMAPFTAIFFATFIAFSAPVKHTTSYNMYNHLKWVVKYNQ